MLSSGKYKNYMTYLSAAAKIFPMLLVETFVQSRMALVGNHTERVLDI